jgi:surface antigen
LAVSAGSLGSTARAQLLNPFPGYKGPKLTTEDRESSTAAALKLLNDDPARVGQTEAWAGPKSGNRGAWTIRRMFERSGMPCRALGWQIRYAKTQDTRKFNLTACRQSNGEWKLAD